MIPGEGRVSELHQTVLHRRRITRGRAACRRRHGLARAAGAWVSPVSFGARLDWERTVRGDQRGCDRAGRPGQPARRCCAPLPLEPRRLRLGERLLLRRGTGRLAELARDAIRILRCLERHHRGQDPGLAVGDGTERSHLRRERLEHPDAAGARGRGRGLAPLPHSAAPCRADGRSAGRSDPGAHAGRDPDVPLQQPRRAADAAPGRGRVCHCPGPGRRLDPLADARRRRGGLRVPGQDAPGIPRDPRLRIGLSHRGADHVVAEDLAGGRGGPRCCRLGGVVDCARHALAG